MGHIRALVRALPDPRWRLAFQLVVAYGLRPEELQQLHRRPLWNKLRQEYEAGGPT